MSTTTLTTPTVPVSSIGMTEGINPRNQEDVTKGDEFAELVESVKRHGVLQPVLVRPLAEVKKPGGKTDQLYELVAGSRRFAAAKKAKLAEIPVHVQELNGDAAAAATVENVQRKDLTPLEEAEAVQQLRDQLPPEDAKRPTKAVATLLSKSEDWVQKRLQLLELPPAAKEALALGTLGLHGAPIVHRVAKASPMLAGAIVDLVTSEEQQAYTPRDLEDPDYFPEILQEAVGSQLDAESTEAVDAMEAPDVNYPWSRVLMPEAKRAELQEQYDALPDGFGGRRPQVSLDQDDLDAAIAYGCAVEVPNGRYGRSAWFVTDPEFIGDRLEFWFKREIEAGKKRAKQQAEMDRITGRSKSSSSTTPSAEEEAVAKEERRKAREAEAQRRENAHAANLELGRLTAEALRKPKITVPIAQLLVALTREGTHGDPHASLAYVDERWQQSEVKKDGTTKRTFLRQGIAEHVDAQLAKAKSAEEVVGLLLRSLIVTACADEEVVAPSNRIYGGVGQLSDQVQDLALELKVLPPAIKKVIEEERRQERRAEQERVKARQNRVLSELVATGKAMTHAQLVKAVGHGGEWYSRPEAKADGRLASYVPETMLGQALGALQRGKLVAKKGSGQETTYSATTAGKTKIAQLAKGDGANA